MAKDQDLFGKTFDQQVLATDGDIEDRDILPNRRIAGEIIFEPMEPGIRVTARDSEHRVLWGYVGCEGTLKQVHCLVAVYDTLQGLLHEELEKRGKATGRRDGDPIEAALNVLERLEETTKWLRDSLQVKDATAATVERARSIAKIVSDADRQITLEAETLKGMKTRNQKAVGADL